MSRPLNDIDRRAHYLGDGLYVDLANCQVRLFTTNGIEVTNEVFLDPEVLEAFDAWLENPTSSTPDELFLWKWEHDFGRMGNLGGCIIASKSDVRAVYGKEVYFGDVLGKHSDVSCLIREEDFTAISNDQDLIQKILNLIGSTVSGYNPLEYIEK